MICRCFGLFLLLAVLAGTGCIQQKVRVVVNPDGSGKILVSRYYTPAGVTMVEASIKQMEAAMETGDMGGMMVSMDLEKTFYNEDSIRSMAILFGPHVTLDKSKEINVAGNRGYAAVYSFEAVNDLILPFDLESVMMMESMGMTGQATTPEALVSSIDMFRKDTVEFIFEPDSGVLTLELPAFVSETPEPPPTNNTESAFTEEDEAEMMMFMGGGMMGGGMASGAESMEDMMNQMYGDTRYVLEVQVVGAEGFEGVSHKNAKNPNRFTLFDVDFGDMGSSVMTLIQNSASSMGMGGDSALNQIKGYPGVTMETNNTLTIRFAKQEESE